MSYQLRTFTFDGRSDQTAVDELPDECPICHIKGLQNTWDSGRRLNQCQTGTRAYFEMPKQGVREPIGRFW